MAGDSKGSESRGFSVVDRRVSTMSDEEVEALEEEIRAQAPSYVQELERDLAAHREKLAQVQAAAQQELQQAIEQAKQRLERDAQQRARALRSQLVLPMLEVFEVLERSLQMVEASPSADAMLEGMKMVHQLMIRKLGELGLERIETEGQSFDPARHEAIGLMPTDESAQDQQIAREVSPGFALDGQVMRAPKVMVYRLEA